MDQATEDAAPPPPDVKPDVEMADADTDAGEPSENGGKADGPSSSSALVPAAPTAATRAPSEPPPPSAAAAPVIIDSLPYIDEIHPDYEAYALSLIENEMRGFEPDPNALSYLGHDGLVRDGPRFGTGGRERSTTRAEYDALVARGGAPRPDADGFRPPSAADPPPDAEDPAAWEGSVRAAKVRLESQRARLANLELQSEFEAALWRDFLSRTESGPIRSLAARAEGRRRAVDAINARRQSAQADGAGRELGRLGRRYEELVAGNRRLADAVGRIEGEVRSMREAAGIAEGPRTEGDGEEEDEGEYQGVDVLGDGP